MMTLAIPAQQQNLQQQQLDLQRRQLEIQEQYQKADLELRARVVEANTTNRQEINQIQRDADLDRNAFARRGQTFAMWYTGVVSGTLIMAGLVCIFLGLVSVFSTTAGLTAGGICLAGGLFTSLSKLVGHFLPDRDSGDGQS
jgi:multidrug efflux pump subunit AcrA (membrane-fusion protein)